MSDSFSNELRARADSVWRAIHHHPFLRALGDGSLDTDKFQIWLRQSYLFLIGYARTFAHAAARADRDNMRWMIDMAHGVLHHDMLLHEAYVIEFNLQRDELPNGVKLPTTRAYTDHLLRTASLSSMLELVAALLPYLWTHVEIGQRLACQPSTSDNHYARWIHQFSSPSMQRRVQQGRELLDRLVIGAGAENVFWASDAFMASSRYQWMFLEMCDQGECWPV